MIVGRCERCLRGSAYQSASTDVVLLCGDAAGAGFSGQRGCGVEGFALTMPSLTQTRERVPERHLTEALAQDGDAQAALRLLLEC